MSCSFLARFCFALLTTLIPVGSATELSFNFSAEDYQSGDWTRVGDAFWANDGPLNPSKRLRLTSANGNQSGAVWYAGQTFDLNQSTKWSFEYTGQITYRGNGGADGMGMHFYTGDTTGYRPNFDNNTVASGQGMLTVSLDTWDNGGEPTAYHMTLWNGNNKLAETSLPGESDDQFRFVLRRLGNRLYVDYYERPSDTQPNTISRELSEATWQTFSKVSLGFSARTGGAGENHDVLALNASIAEPVSGAETELTGFVSALGSASESKPFTVSSYTNEVLIATAPLGFELSLDDSSFSGSVEIAANSEETLYIRLASDAAYGEATGALGLVSGDSSASVALSGIVQDIIPSISSFETFSAELGDASIAQQFSLSGNTNELYTVGVSAGFEVSENGTDFSSELETDGSSALFVRIASSAELGRPAGELTISSGLVTKKIALNGLVSLVELTSQYNEDGIPQAFKISGGGPYTLSAPEGFEISLNGTDYFSSVSYPGRYDISGWKVVSTPRSTAMGSGKRFYNLNAFAALQADGSVVTWGKASLGGDSSAVAEQLTSGVTAIYSTLGAFAALKSDGSVVTWGDLGYGGDSSSVSVELSSDVTDIYSAISAFAAVKSDGSVVTWGRPDWGGDSSSVSAELSSDVVAIYSNPRAFAAVKNDGSVVTWGDPGYGGDSSSVSAQLSSGVTAIYSSGYAFAALKSDGSVVTWGNASYGGNSSAVSAQISSDVSSICPSVFSFAALKSDGSVVTWGSSSVGGDSRSVASKLGSGVTAIYSSGAAFAALKSDGSVVTWGFAQQGGDSSSVSAQLSSDVTKFTAQHLPSPL